MFSTSQQQQTSSDWHWLALSVSGAQHLLWLTQQETLESNLLGPTQTLCNTSTQANMWI